MPWGDESAIDVLKNVDQESRGVVMRKIIYLEAFLLGAIAVYFPAVAQGQCVAKPQIAQPASKTATKDFYEWAKSHKSLLKEKSIDVDQFNDAYLVDIDNDGKLEYVFMTFNGSGHYLDLLIFKKTNGKFSRDYLPTPVSFTQDGFWYSAEYINQLTGKSELFVELCGKTYISFNDGSYQDPVREVFIWEHSETRQVCTPEWASIHRDFFNQLYSKQRFEAASSYMRGVLRTCGKEFPKKLHFWMLNDEALAAFKKGDPVSCLSTIGSIKAHKEFASMSGKLKAAIKHNEQLCSVKAESDKTSGSAGQYDYSWLLSFNGKSTNEVVWDKRFNGLLSAVVPNSKSNYSKDPGQMKSDLKLHLSGPPSVVQIKDDRFIVLSACWAHSCGNKGIIWIDNKQKISAMAFGSDGSMTVASRSIKAMDLPSELVLALKAWAKSEGLKIGRVTFYDFSGSSKDVSRLLK